MARPRQEILITQSLIDRLCDIEPWPTSRKDSIAMFKQSLKRDVEWLLNTRKPIVPHVDDYPETSASVLCYGLPEAKFFDSSSGKQTDSMLLALRQCVQEFEPRIENPQVSLVVSDPLTRSLRFQVEGVIRYEDMEEEIQLDTVLELISGEYEVR